ncbi:metallo-beta-lactamase superfamily protein [Streptococcus pneumoniae]|nr:metallo-beta-lactamase superfamily protein [Streptococcus pneumoniae]
MKIYKTVNPVAYENTYYLEGEKHLIVVDPGSHWEAIRQTIEKINKPICAILLTHAHYDHIMSLDLVRETFGNPPVYIAESEASWLVLAIVSNSYPPLPGRLPTRYSPVRNSSREASSSFSVLLACIRHAASVRPEPGSNSH